MDYEGNGEIECEMELELLFLYEMDYYIDYYGYYDDDIYVLTFYNYHPLSLYY